VASTLVYAVAAITLAARIFGAEAVLFSEQSGWSDLFRRPREDSATPTVSAALLCLALLLPGIFLLGGFVARAPRDSQLAYQLAGAAVLFAVVPLFACLAGRINLQTGLQLTVPHLLAFPAALLLAAAAIPLNYMILYALRSTGLIFASQEVDQHAHALAQTWLRHPFAAVAATLAVMGMAEEVLFRGYLFSALRAHAGPWVTIGVSALLFGLFHCVVQFDRLIPSTLMGLLLGWLCWQTRSVFPGMVLHAAFNATLIWLLYQDAGRQASANLHDLPLWWLIAALPMAAIGVALAYKARKPATEPKT
jgi:ABC-2 type transport system permease protein/sodium transport system permease protein